MQISKISLNQQNQNFGGVIKVVKPFSQGYQTTTFLTQKGRLLGQHILKKNGDVFGFRHFSGKESITYATTEELKKSNGIPKAVSLIYNFPARDKRSTLSKQLIFKLEDFKEHLKELTSLSGLKRFLA